MCDISNSTVIILWSRMLPLITLILPSTIISPPRTRLSYIVLIMISKIATIVLVIKAFIERIGLNILSAFRKHLHGVVPIPPI